MDEDMKFAVAIFVGAGALGHIITLALQKVQRRFRQKNSGYLTNSLSEKMRFQSEQEIK